MKNGKLLTLMILLGVLLLSLSIARSEPIPQIYQRSYDEEAKGHYQEAISVLTQAGRAGDTSYLYHLRLGWLQYLAGKYPESIDSYRKAVMMSKGSIEAKLGLMLPQMAQEKWHDAEKTGREILSTDKLSYLANSRLAYVYYNLKRYKDAEASYRTVLSYYPGDIEMQAGLAWSLLKQNKKEAAKKVFSEILRYVPNHISANEGMKIVRER